MMTYNTDLTTLNRMLWIILSLFQFPSNILYTYAKMYHMPNIYLVSLLFIYKFIAKIIESDNSFLKSKHD